jgi:hypothetical protein
MPRLQGETQLLRYLKRMKNEMLRKFYCFGCVCLYALAAIGGVAYLFSDSHGVFAIAAIATTAMATPYLIERIKELMS